VAKVFCQAEAVVDGVVDIPSLVLTVKYIVDHIEDDGSFVDNEPVVHREMQVRQ